MPIQNHDAVVKAAAALHRKDPLYVNSHEQTIATIAFSSGVDWYDKKVSSALSLLPETEKLLDLTINYLRSKTDQNLRDLNRQRSLVDTLLKSCKSYKLYESKPVSKESPQKPLFD